MSRTGWPSCSKKILVSRPLAVLLKNTKQGGTLKICRLIISNFRGVRSGEILFPDHAVLIGDNNIGKTTILEALDLALGPDRLNRTPPIDEHDFHLGQYLPPAQSQVGANAEDTSPSAAPEITVEATISGLSPEQVARFVDYIEFWDTKAKTLDAEANLLDLDAQHVTDALRVTFKGRYDADDDDFVGQTFFTRSLSEAAKGVVFGKKDKQMCGFLFLRTQRTGTRALSLERGSLLDIVLRLKEVRPRMWEETIDQLAKQTVAADPELGLSSILDSISKSLQKYVPKEWGVAPHLKVSNLTREHLRKVITAFIATGDGQHAAPYFRQGTGTINMLVLALLSQIAEGKQNVIFAMEEPEIAIPPYAQKRIIHEVRKLASQTIFTSHSPYVLEEFGPGETLVLRRDEQGQLAHSDVVLPESVKLKRYQQEFRTRFCEGLLARRVLVAEGATEYDSFPVVCRRLAELNPAEYAPLEALGICTIDAGGESNIPDMGRLYLDLGKVVFALCDKQTATAELAIKAQVDILYMHDEVGFEDLVLKGTTEAALIRFANQLAWPQHLVGKYPHPQRDQNIRAAVSDYFRWSKASYGVADFLAQCLEGEIPAWLCETCKNLRLLCSSSSDELMFGERRKPKGPNVQPPENADTA